MQGDSQELIFMKTRQTSKNWKVFLSICLFYCLKTLLYHSNGINIIVWKADKKDTEGSSQEQASLLLTECNQHSLHLARKPMYILYF